MTEHRSKCAARNATSNYCRKTECYERTYPGKRGGDKGRVGLIHGDTELEDQFADHGDLKSQQNNSVRWVKNHRQQSHEWDSDSSDNYMVMSIRKNKEEHEFKVAGVRLPIKIIGNITTAKMDSVSPISIFTIGELKKTLGKAEVQLLSLGPNDDHFRDNGNNPLKFMGKTKVMLTGDEGGQLGG